MGNIKIQLKRHNGTDYDVLHPETEIDQVTGLLTELNRRVPTNALGANSGVATLNSSGKLSDTQVPGWLINGAGKPFLGEISGNRDLTTLALAVSTYMSSHGYVTPASWEALYGAYFQCTTNVTLSWTDTADIVCTVNPGDEGDTTSPIYLESGDMLVFKSYSESGEPVTAHYGFFVMNNTYGNASTDMFGVTKLSNITGYLGATGNNVITAGVLAGLVGTDEGKIAAGDHTHASTYLAIGANAASASKWAAGRTITLGGDLSGSVSIDGSENVTLTATVADNSHNHSAYITYNEVEQDYERVFTKNSAFNKNFGTGNTDVARGDHTHDNRYFTETEVTNLLTNRPEIYYNTTTGVGTGDYVIAIITP